MGTQSTLPSASDVGLSSPYQSTAARLKQIRDQQEAAKKMLPPGMPANVLYPTNPDQFSAWLARYGRQPNTVAVSTQQEQATIAAEGEPIRILYGRRQVGGQILWLGPDSTSYYFIIQAAWCLGEADSIESIQLNNTNLPDGASVTHYLGTISQGVDPLLSNTIRGYSNSMVFTAIGQQVGVCYSVLRVPVSSLNGFPNLTAIVRGRKVYDPRDTTWKYSNNPSLIFADFETSKLYGRGRLVDWNSISEAANANDELVGGVKRRTLSLSIEERADVDTYASTLAQYAGAFISNRGGKTYLVPDRPKAIARTLTASQIQGLTLSEPKLANTPTVVSITYTNTSGAQWREDVAQAKLTGVDEGTVAYREQLVRLQGIDNHEEAYRHAIETLNAVNIVNMAGQFITQDQGVLFEIGDRLNISHPIGLTNKDIQVIGIQEVDRGRWRVQFVEYDEGKFSNDIVSGPNYNDTSLPDPLDVPAVLNLQRSEEVYQNENGIYASRIRATWDELSNYPYTHQYRYGVYVGSTLIWQGITNETQLVTGAIQEKVTYTISVVAVNPATLATSPASTTTITAQGKSLKPSDVPQITAIQTGASAVKLTWLPAVDIDIWRYEVREGATWNGATFINQVDSLELTVTGVSAGSHTYLVKAIDSVRQYSTNAATVTIAVSAPVGPATLSGFEVGGEVRLSWPAGTGFVSTYEVRYGTVGFSWASGKVIDRIAALRLTTKDVAAGTWDFLIRAVDDAGNYSSNEARVTVTVTLDSAAFTVDSVTFTSPTLTDMASWSHRPEDDAVVTYVTDRGDNITSLFPNAMATYTDVLATYHTSGTSEWLSESHDFGQTLSGTFMLETTASALDGTFTAYLELSTDNTTWTQYSVSSVKATARYARVRIQSVNTLIIKTPGASIRISVVPREETHTVSVSSSGTTITLDNIYVSTQSIIVTPMGTSAQTYAVDNITMGDPSSFDLYLFNSSGALISGSALVTFKGV